MNEILRLSIAILVLLLGIPLGNWLSKVAKEELKQGQRWFKLIIILSLVGAVITLITRDDGLFFSFLFIVIVTSRSLRK